MPHALGSALYVEKYCSAVIYINNVFEGFRNNRDNFCPECRFSLVAVCGSALYPYLPPGDSIIPHTEQKNGCLHPFLWAICWFPSSWYPCPCIQDRNIQCDIHFSSQCVDFPLVDIPLLHTMHKQRLSTFSFFLRWKNVGIYSLSTLWSRYRGYFLGCIHLLHIVYHAVRVQFFGSWKCFCLLIWEYTVLSTLSY